METKRSSIIGWSVFSVVVWSVLVAVMFTGPEVETNQPPAGGMTPPSQTQVTLVG